MKTMNAPEVDRLMADADRWGPGGDMGNSEAHAARSTPQLEAEAEHALGMKLISIRLDQSLLRDLKEIAAHHGIGYQPMVRDLLKRFARAEIKTILQQRLSEIDAAEGAGECNGGPVKSFFAKQA